MSGHRRKWDNTNLIVPFTFLNVELVNHIGFSFKMFKPEKCAISLEGRACSKA